MTSNIARYKKNGKCRFLAYSGTLHMQSIEVTLKSHQNYLDNIAFKYFLSMLKERICVPLVKIYYRHCNFNCANSPLVIVITSRHINISVQIV